MGDFASGRERAPKVSSAFKDITKAFEMYFPSFARSIRTQIPKFANVDAQTQKNLAPTFASTENRLRKIMQQGEASRIKNIGSGSVRDIYNIGRENDPEYFANRASVANNLQQLMQPGLTGGETEAIRRGIRTDSVGRGTGNVDSNMNTISSATMFGDAARNRMERATSLAGSLQPSLQYMTPESTFSIASGRDIVTPGRAANTNAGLGVGMGLLEGMTGIKGTGMNVNAQRKSIPEYATEGIGSVCGCYIFRAHYGINIPWWVVFARDYFHSQDPMLGYGYKKMAKWLVPLMKRWVLVRKLVDYLMIRPLTIYGGYMYHVDGFDGGWIFKPIVQFWFRIWKKG